MALSLADKLNNSGIAYPAAIEIARQMTVGAPAGGVPDRMITVGIVPMQATELARQINAGAFSAHLLATAMWNPATAKVIKTESGL